MEKYQKILVCLDQSSRDINLIKTASKICELSPREITFINVIRDFDLPGQMKKEFPNFMDKALEDRKAEIRESVKEHFSWPDVDVSIKILQGQPAKSILKYSDKKDIDLIISGRKSKDSMGVVRSRLARRANCSFLMVAEGNAFDLERILVPIDFSEYSRIAILKAIDLANLVPNEVEIYAQNVYAVPTGYHYAGKTLEEFAQIMRDNAVKNFESFMRTIDTDGKEIKPIYSHDDNENFVSDVRDEAKNLDASLIIIGAKGQTATSAILIGSKAERLVTMDTKSSMLVFRVKGDKSGFREFIKNL